MIACGVPMSDAVSRLGSAGGLAVSVPNSDIVAGQLFYYPLPTTTSGRNQYCANDQAQPKLLLSRPSQANPQKEKAGFKKKREYDVQKIPLGR